MTRVLLAALSGAVVSLGVTAGASAKGFPLVFDRTSATPGDRVTVSSPYELDTGARALLVDARETDDVRRFLPKDPRLIDIGELGERGSLTFALPHLRPGAYTTAVFVRGAFYVTQPHARAAYRVRGPIVLHVRGSPAAKPGNGCCRGTGRGTCLRRPQRGCANRTSWATASTAAKLSSRAPSSATASRSGLRSGPRGRMTSAAVSTSRVSFHVAPTTPLTSTVPGKPFAVINAEYIAKHIAGRRPKARPAGGRRYNGVTNPRPASTTSEVVEPSTSLDHL